MKRNLNYKQFNSRNLRGAKKENRKMRRAQHTQTQTQTLKKKLEKLNTHTRILKEPNHSAAMVVVHILVQTFIHGYDVTMYLLYFFQSHQQETKLRETIMMI